MPPILSIHDNYDAAKESAKSTIASGGVLIYPTDTLYGLGCSALDEKAISRIRGMKKREGNKPLSILVSDFAMLKEFCSITSEQEKILQELLPGPYTFILPLKKKLPVSDTLEAGVRVPEHMFMRQVSRELKLPIVTTSANLSSGQEASELSGVSKEISSQCDLLIDGGKCRYAQGSTVIDLIRMKVLRKGAVRQGDKIEW